MRQAGERRFKLTVRWDYPSHPSGTWTSAEAGATRASALTSELDQQSRAVRNRGRATNEGLRAAPRRGTDKKGEEVESVGGGGRTSRKEDEDEDWGVKSRLRKLVFDSTCSHAPQKY